MIQAMKVLCVSAFLRVGNSLEFIRKINTIIWLIWGNVYRWSCVVYFIVFLIDLNVPIKEAPRLALVQVDLEFAVPVSIVCQFDYSNQKWRKLISFDLGINNL